MTFAIASLLAFVLSPLPDPLVSSGGQVIAQASEWPARRAELAEIIQAEGIGHLPPPPRGMEAKILRSESLGEGKVSYQLIRLTWQSVPGVDFDVALFVPEGASAVIIHPSFAATPGDAPPPDADANFKLVGPDEFAEERRDVLSRGYAILTYFYQEAAADHKSNRDTGFYRGLPPSDAGTLAIWAWALSRAVDYVETRKLGPIVAVGHSRLGKATLIAGAYDQRIAVVVPAGSGAGGTGAFRVSGKARTGKEGLEEVTHHFPFWFGSRLLSYVGRVEALPYDAHDLEALVAPRAFLDTEGLADPAANGRAAIASFRAVQPVYHLLGADDRLGLNFRPGGHALTDDDWQAILDFADHQLKGTPYHRPFHAIPADSLLK